MGLEEGNWLPRGLSYSREGAFWPGSGQTLFSLSGSSNQKAFNDLSAVINSQSEAEQKIREKSLIAGLVKNFKGLDRMKQIDLKSAFGYLKSLKPQPAQYPELPMINLQSESANSTAEIVSDPDLFKNDSPELESWLETQVASQ